MTSDTFSSRVKDVGDWLISFDVPGDGSVAASNRFVDRSVGFFLEAFAGLGEVERASGDVEVLDDTGRRRQFFEDVPLRDVGGHHYRSDPRSGVPMPGDLVLVSAVRLDCGLRIVEGDRTISLGETFRFVHLCDQDLTEDDRVVQINPIAFVATSTDVWLDVTFDPKTRRPRDNRRTAALNRPRLEAFLHRWEQFAGKPITEWTSEQTKRIQRYGFSPVPRGEEW
jgi:hypothetical protein